MSEVITANIEDLLARLRNENQSCEEASPRSKETFIPCGAPAVALVDNGDSRPYFMCFGCADHNEKNRGAKILGTKDAMYQVRGGQTVYSETLARPSTDTTLNQLFSQYAILSTDKDQKEMELDAIDAAITDLNAQIIPLMVELEFQSIDYNGEKYYLAVPERPSIIPETRDDFMVWLEANGEYGIVQTTYVNSNTLWSWRNNLDEVKKEALAALGYLKISEDIQLRRSKGYKRTRKKK